MTDRERIEDIDQKIGYLKRMAKINPAKRGMYVYEIHHLEKLRRGISKRGKL